MYRIVFSDVDGTLLDSCHRVSERTRTVLKALYSKRIPFVIVSARSPSAIYTVQRQTGIGGPIVAYSGSLILDEDRKVLFSRGIGREEAADILRFVEEKHYDCAWCLYSNDDWLVADKNDPQVIREEKIVEVQSRVGNVDSLSGDAVVHKILLLCQPGIIDGVERDIKARFPDLSVAQSSPILLEIMPAGISKGMAVETYCRTQQVPVADSVAFGDNYNDSSMLESAGLGVLMGNAPQDLKNRFIHVVEDNDHDGVALELQRLFSL